MPPPVLNHGWSSSPNSPGSSFAGGLDPLMPAYGAAMEGIPQPEPMVPTLQAWIIAVWPTTAARAFNSMSRQAFVPCLALPRLQLWQKFEVKEVVDQLAMVVAWRTLSCLETWK